MPYGFFTIERWATRAGKSQWVPVRHLNTDKSLSDAIRALEENGRAGFFRVVQTQRMIWAEKENGKLRLRKWHAENPKTLMRTAKAYARDGGKWRIPSRNKSSS